MQGLTLDVCHLREAFQGRSRAKLLAALKPGDAVITPKLDRMFRSAVDALSVCGRLERDGITLHIIDLGGDVTGYDIGKLVVTTLSAIAEAERKRVWDMEAD
jgi:DNA invertase Pin-like site-specific DNA recombinase